MKKCVMLSVMVLTLGMVGIVNGGTLYVSLTDAMWSVGWYDLAGNYVWMHTFPSLVQDIEFDKATGDLFALTDTGIFRLDQGGAHTQITGAAYPDAGGDIAISSNGYVAASLTDAMPSVGIYDLDGNYVGMVTFPSAVADIEYDQATGDLYAYTATGVFKMTDLGPPAVITQITGIAGAAQGQGGDIAISSDGLLAVSMNDTMNAVGIYYLSGAYYDMANFNSPVADIDYDMDTGDLYALTAVGIKKFVDTPGPYNGGAVTQITGVGADLNGGGDLAWAPDWECAEPVDCYDDDACTVDDCDCVDNLCVCNEPTPLVCNDDNDCTDDTCDSVIGCVYTCNATDYTDECCVDDACSEEPVCTEPVCGDGVVEPPEECDPPGFDAPGCDPGSEFCNQFCICSPVPIELNYFTAKGMDQSVVISWGTATETDNAGFNILRSDTEDGVYTPINDELILALGTPSSGWDYYTIDFDVVNGTTYWYKLEDVDIYAGSTIHEPPVSATPEASAGLWGPDSSAEASALGSPGSESVNYLYLLTLPLLFIGVRLGILAYRRKR